MNTEIWKSVEGYEDLYEVSNLGRIRSLTREITSRNQYGYFRFMRKGQIMKPKRNTCNHYQVELKDENNKPKSFKISRLVALAFIDNPKKYTHTLHIDKNQLNNSVSNLKWVDKFSAVQYASYIPNRKIKCVETGETFHYFSEITKKYGIKEAQILKCCSNKYPNKSACGYHWEYVED